MHREELEALTAARLKELSNWLTFTKGDVDLGSDNGGNGIKRSWALQQGATKRQSLCRR